MPKVQFAFASIAALALGLAALTAVQAQYPPPGPVFVSLSGSQARPPVGSNVMLTCAAMDTAGKPVVGQAATFTITAQPGSDAALSPIIKVTDANGKAVVDLFTGSRPGVVVVNCQVGGNNSQLIVEVLGVVVTPVATPVPPVGIRPPTTGDGGLVDRKSIPGEIFPLALLVSLTVLSAAMVKLGQRR